MLLDHQKRRERTEKFADYYENRFQRGRGLLTEYSLRNILLLMQDKR